MNDTNNNLASRVEQQRGVWSTEEHDKFLVALRMHPEGPWKAIADHIGTRSPRQVQTHAQKYYEKVARRVRGLRKDRKKVVRSEHRLDEDMVDLCKDAEGDEEAAALAQAERTRRGLTSIAMRRRSASPRRQQVAGPATSGEGVEVKDESMAVNESSVSEDSDSSLSSLDQDCLDYLVSILESREYDSESTSRSE